MLPPTVAHGRSIGGRVAATVNLAGALRRCVCIRRLPSAPAWPADLAAVRWLCGRCWPSRPRVPVSGMHVLHRLSTPNLQLRCP
ncbi:hypothetical protein PJP10_12060 [Mycobacterium kansasii]